MYKREVGRIALQEYGDGAALVMSSTSAIREQRFIVEAPSIVAAANSGVAEVEASVDELEALVRFIADSVKSVEGVANVEWSSMNGEQRVGFIDSFGAARVAVIYKYYAMLKAHRSGLMNLPDSVLEVIATGHVSKPEVDEEE